MPGPGVAHKLSMTLHPSTPIVETGCGRGSNGGTPLAGGTGQDRLTVDSCCDSAWQEWTGLYHVRNPHSAGVTLSQLDIFLYAFLVRGILP